MPRATIDFGIDLGTTSSCLACFQGGGVEIIRNNEGFETTPSAVGINRKGRLQVGRPAKEQVEVDEENACIEFKLQMGKATGKVFQRTGQQLTPEELSAEVLKSLLADVRQRKGEEVQAAVITVPADFDLPQCDATRRAAQLAGLKVSPLLQEPVAAALAHGFQSASEKVYWLVYDLGGGTFDAAVIQMRDGVFRVVNHGGDRHLGGKLLDWAIVEQVLAPQLVREYALADFHRGNRQWRPAFAKLKLAAEQAKIRLSRDPVTEVSITLPVEKGETLEFETEVQRAEVEALIEPLVLRSINLCKKVLAEKRLAPHDVEKVLLVGGPTLTPYLRTRLADRAGGLGIPLEVSLDPLTVVAIGAAIFAGTQRLEGPLLPAVGQYALELEYQPVGADPEPLVGGKVLPPSGRGLAGHTIEFVEADVPTPRRSDKQALSVDGTFLTNLWAVPGRPTTFRIELRDADGQVCSTVPERLTFTLGNAPTDPPLTHSVGVAMANNEMDVFIPKGTALPARQRIVHRTTELLRRGQAANTIRIPVVEGDNTRRADRNRLIGTLEISAVGLARDVPSGSEIEITIDMDQSRLVQTRAYIPVLDAEFKEVITLHLRDVDLAQLAQAVAAELSRLEETRHQVDQVGDPAARQLLQEGIDRERIAQDVQAALVAAAGDPDAADKCQYRLLALKTALDQVEEALEWPALRDQVEQRLTELRDLVRQHGEAAEKKQAALLEAEIQQVLKTRQADQLRRKSEEVLGLNSQILIRQPSFLVEVLDDLRHHQDQMSDPDLATQLFAQAHRAMEANDLPLLHAALRQLLALLPPKQQQARSGFGGTTMR